MANAVTRIIISAVDKTKEAFASVESGLKSIAVRAIALTGTALSIRGIADMADEFANLQARLKLASRNTDEFNQANADLSRIASTAKVPLSETAQLYTRIAASVKDLNVSQGDIAGTTEAVALALKVSGASAAESSSAMLQFSQAIASGVLRGEEFNAISEAAPRLLQALAKSLDVPTGSLREMATQGKLTRGVLINGLLNELPKLRDEAASLPDTFGSTFTDLKNQLLLSVGAINEATDATKGLSGALATVGGAGIKALAVSLGAVIYLFKEAGRALGGLVAQFVQLAKLNLKGFKAVSTAMAEDADTAQEKFGAFIKKILGDDKKLNDERQDNSNETRDIVIEDKKKEAEAFKKETNEQISDAKRLQSALTSAFDTALKSETDYLRQAKKLRDEANGKTSIGDDPESQALGRLSAITAAMKLQREAGTASLETVQDQAEALRSLAEQLDDAALKSDLLRQASLSEATAFERAAAEESERARGLSAQQDEATRRIENMQGALEGIGKEVSVELKPGVGMAKVKQDLTEIKHLIDYIKANPVRVDVAGGSTSDALRDEARKYGRR